MSVKGPDELVFACAAKTPPLHSLTLHRQCDRFYKAISPGTVSRRKEARTMRVIITMACTDCKRRNYTTTKNKKSDPNRIELNKYCPTCQASTVHKETR